MSLSKYLYIQSERADRVTTACRALITGGGRGIGRAIVRRFAAAGASVAFTYRTDDPQSLLHEINALGGRGYAFQLDLTDLPAIPRVMSAAAEALGGLDVLVNNAGYGQIKPFGAVTEADWDAVFAVNAKGIFFAMQAAAPHMTDGGSIINIASIAGRRGRPLFPHYAASKAAAISVTQAAAQALAPRIRVNAVCPGLIDTDLWNRLDRESAGHSGVGGTEFLRERIAAVPLKRLGMPEEVADVVWFLASDASRYMTGQALNVCGGTEMQ